MDPTFTYLERLWNAGQSHLAAGRYVAARRDLEAAEQLAWRRRDPAALARLYLPLLETRRQIRLAAAEGPLVILPPCPPHERNRILADFLHQPAGTILLACHHPCTFAGTIHYAARRTFHPLEALLLLEHAGNLRLAAPADPVFTAGLPTRTTTHPADLITPDPLTEPTIPLPPVGTYTAADALHPLFRESILIAWEALALKWQSRHPIQPLPGRSGWEELAWLRLALRIDPACEPITQRLITVAEALERPN